MTNRAYRPTLATSIAPAGTTFLAGTKRATLRSCARSRQYPRQRALRGRRLQNPMDASLAGRECDVSGLSTSKSIGGDPAEPLRKTNRRLADQRAGLFRRTIDR